MRTLPRLLAPVVLAVLHLSGCAQARLDEAAAAGAAPAAAPGSGPARAIVRAFASPPDTVRLSPEPLPPGPTVEYASLESVRDSVLAIVQRLAPRGDTAIHVSVAPVWFKYWYLPDSASGYAVRVVVTDSTFCPVEEVAQALTAGGWAPHSGYSADGTDGTVMGFETTKYVCILEGRWDGGDDSDPTYVPAPGCSMTATCVPRLKKDVPPY